MSEIEDAIASEDWGTAMRLAFKCREARAEGRYCECSEPDVAGVSLMCAKCGLSNKDQERKACDVICKAHDFVPGALEGLLCKQCTMSADAPRHHGVDTTPRYSWDSQ